MFRVMVSVPSGTSLRAAPTIFVPAAISAKSGVSPAVFTVMPILPSNCSSSSAVPPASFWSASRAVFKSPVFNSWTAERISSGVFPSALFKISPKLSLVGISVRW